tara:strand:+ start:1853 stop:1957 length:105 start_codon:yes stop_codon:yes gene_type:complete
MISFHEERHKVFQYRFQRPANLTLIVSGRDGYDI